MKKANGGFTPVPIRRVYFLEPIYGTLYLGHEAYQSDFVDMRRRVPDTTKIQQFIGWQPERSLDETLRDIVSGFRDAPDPDGRGRLTDRRITPQ